MKIINELDNDFKNLLEQELKITISEIIKLKGDASYRSYYRIKVKDSSETFVVMQWDPLLTGKSEEATKSSGINEFPFINICNYLNRIGIPVPSIIYSNIQKGIILLEDLGDTTLERQYKTTFDPGLYAKAIELLAELKSLTFLNPDRSCIAYRRNFDYDLYMWEFDHFIEYGIEARNNIKIPDSDRNMMQNYFSDISRMLDSNSNVFTHRDYQSRNIMIKDGKFYLIDFQDALIGTPVYDIVALLRDSYITFEDKIISDFKELYLGELKKRGIIIDRDLFMHLFDLQTIQRKLKDGGRFIYIDRVKKNPSFLPYVATSFRYAAEAMKGLYDLRGLYKLLSKYVPEFCE